MSTTIATDHQRAPDSIFAIWSDASRQSRATALFLLCAFILGGGGHRYPLSEMLVYLAALPCLYLTWRDMAVNGAHAGRLWWLLIAAILAMLILQLIPLPPALWQALPGRALLGEAQTLLGDNAPWRPLTIAPELTISSALYLIVPVTAFLAACQMPQKSWKLLLWALMLAVIVHLAASALQLLSGGENYYLYPTSHEGVAVGLFANRNHAAMLFLAGIVMLAPLLRRHISGISPGNAMVYAAAVIIAIIAIVTTRSRAVTVLTLLVLPVLTLLLIPSQYRKIGSWAVAAGGVIFAGIILLAWQLGRLGNLTILASRFEQDDDHRFEFWPDTIETLTHYFPFGSGLGTFDLAFRSQERLEIIGSHYVNHAHNDYVEIAIETGFLGIALLIGLFVLTLRDGIYAARTAYSRQMPSEPAYALIIVTAIAAHSLIDYPVRSLSVAALLGMLLGFIHWSRQASGNSSG